MSVGDLAGPDHWEAVWRRQRVARVRRLNYYHHRLEQVFESFARQSSRVLEVGCGGSRWLPHLARRYGCEIWGVDYSREGLRLVRRNAAAVGVGGKLRLIEGDFFKVDGLPAGAFDVVYSMGFLEHLVDPGPAVERTYDLLVPGGHAIQVVPNLEGFVGWLHRTADRAVFEKHVVITPRQLDRMHAERGFHVVNAAAYVGVFGLTVVNFDRIRSFLPRIVDGFVWVCLHAIQQFICLGPRLAGAAPESRCFSPWIVGVYQRPR